MPVKELGGGAAVGAAVTQAANALVQWVEAREAVQVAEASQLAYTQLLVAFQDVVARCGAGG